MSDTVEPITTTQEEQEEEAKQPTLGQIVHVVEHDGERKAAIVSGFDSEGKPLLHVFDPYSGNGVRFMGAIKHAEEKTEEPEAQWHFADSESH